MEGELGVHTAEASNQVILEGPDGPFSGVAPVNSRGDKLVVNFNIGHVGLENVGALIVQALETRSEAGLGEGSNTALVGLEDGWGMPGRNGLGINEVAIVVVEDKEVVVAKTRGSGEAPGLIGIDQASGIGFNHGGKAMMRGIIGGFTAGESEGSVGVI